MEYTAQELMVVAGARQIRDGEVAFVGMRLPLLAFCLAKSTHAPRAVGLFENGIVRETPAPELLYTMSDPPNISGAAWCTSLQNVMALLRLSMLMSERRAVKLATGKGSGVSAMRKRLARLPFTPGP